MVGFQGRIRGQLTLYVRQLAWLRAVPKPPEGSRRAGAEHIDDPLAKLSREERLKRDGVQPAFPPCPMPHFVAWFIEIGMCELGGMAARPLSWSEISAWRRLTGIRMEPWEARLLRTLSVAYLAELSLAEDMNRPPPWQTGMTARERDLEAARLDMVLG